MREVSVLVLKLRRLGCTTAIVLDSDLHVVYSVDAGFTSLAAVRS